MRTYTHAPRALIEAETTRANTLSSDHKFQLFNEEGETIGEHKIKRRYEFNGAGNLYLCDVIKYICTHEPRAIKKGGFTRFEVRLQWDSFVKRAIGDYSDQYHRLCNEIWRTQNGGRPCYIPKDGGGWFLMQPFIVDLESEDGTRLTTAEKKRLGNLKHNDGTRKLRYITIAFAKPLFQKYLDGGQYYQHPACLYAQVHDIIEREKKCYGHPLRGKETFADISIDEMRIEINKLSRKELKKLKRNLDNPQSANQELKSEDMEFPIISAIDYLYLHGAGDPRKSYIELPIDDFLNHCNPSALTIIKGKLYQRRDKMTLLFQKLIIVLSFLEGLDFSICIQGKDFLPGINTLKKDGIEYLYCKLDHPDRLKSV